MLKSQAAFNPVSYCPQMRIQLLKRASGYKPFLYDIRHSDLCEYLDRRNHPFVNIIFNSFANHTNVNRCPLPVSKAAYK